MSSCYLIIKKKAVGDVNAVNRCVKWYPHGVLIVEIETSG